MTPGRVHTFNDDIQELSTNILKPDVRALFFSQFYRSIFRLRKGVEHSSPTSLVCPVEYLNMRKQNFRTFCCSLITTIVSFYGYTPEEKEESAEFSGMQCEFLVTYHLLGIHIVPIDTEGAVQMVVSYQCSANQHTLSITRHRQTAEAISGHTTDDAENPYHSDSSDGTGN
jgi:hypothetical protein